MKTYQEFISEHIVNSFDGASRKVLMDAVWKPFRRGASVANSSHFFVEITEAK